MAKHNKSLDRSGGSALLKAKGKRQKEKGKRKKNSRRPVNSDVGCLAGVNSVMKRRIYRAVVFLVVSGASIIATGQEAELSLYNKITAAIGKTEPAFRLDRKAILPNQLVMRWSSDKGRALVSIVWFASEPEAKGALKSKIAEWEHIPEAKTSKRELNDFGDEGYILKTDARGNIFFKKGVYVVQVVGPSDDTARKFARQVSDLLPASNKLLDASRGSVFRMKLS